MTYKRVTEEERRLMAQWRQEGRGVNEIGRLLKRPGSTVSRELKRNTGLRGYRHRQAQAAARSRAERPGPRRLRMRYAGTLSGDL